MQANGKRVAIVALPASLLAIAKLSPPSSAVVAVVAAVAVVVAAGSRQGLAKPNQVNSLNDPGAVGPMSRRKKKNDGFS